MKCLFNKIQSNIAIWQYIAIHSNTIRNNNGIDPYCFTPSYYTASYSYSKAIPTAGQPNLIASYLASWLH